jgi:putative glutamine amidotransferase
MRIAVSVSKKEKESGNESAYFKALVAAGARREEIELVTPDDAGPIRARDYDGILFAGGEDVDPALYGESKKYQNVRVNRARDDFEFRLLDEARAQRLPVFGVCRGLQMINVKFRGTLYQDLEEQQDLKHKQDEKRTETTHWVTVTDPESRLREMLEGSCRVNSMHHQAIHNLGRGLKAVAHSSEDGLVEAVEAADGYPFLLAVQWHPEEMVADHPEQRKLLELFIARCREESAQRAEHIEQNGGVAAS